MQQVQEGYRSHLIEEVGVCVYFLRAVSIAVSSSYLEKSLDVQVIVK